MFYTYLWLRYWGQPYYVGKASGLNRVYMRHHGRVGKCPSRDRVVIQEHVTEKDAVEAEKFLIGYYGRKDLSEGCLINLTDGGEGSCGATVSEFHKNKLRKIRVKDIMGHKFGRLEVLCSAGTLKNRHHYWLCRCTCGNLVTVEGSNLRRGNTTSCGCVQKEYAKTRKYTHSKITREKMRSSRLRYLHLMQS